ncbi:helix-turn-helix domain-containing protein [Micromonospora sp. R77]|uniref:helix-turn-helix domain-containing protein n=1 Tax=Micromonospora sp. R77 TaxID=2925836 RepID=UPI0035B2775F
MSVEAVTWALAHAPDVPPSCLAVLIGLANHADDAGRGAFPRQERLAFYARKTVRSVQSDLKTLEKLGLIRRGDQSRAAFLAADRRPVVWDLALDRRRPLPGSQEPLAQPQPGECQQPHRNDEARTAGLTTGTKRGTAPFSMGQGSALDRALPTSKQGEAHPRTGRSPLPDGVKPTSRRGEAHYLTTRSTRPNGTKRASDEPSLTIKEISARPRARTATGASADSRRADQCARHRGSPARNCGPCRAETLGGVA